MSLLTQPVAAELSPSESAPANHGGPLQRYMASLLDLTRAESPWSSGTYLALLSLVLLWGVRFYTTWATWGNLSIDCGREMYVPAMLARGKMLYRDVWFGYLPAAAYLNATLFRVFGARLEVLYWAGSLAALTCAALVFLLGKRLNSPLAGWTAAAVILLQSFQTWIFCFPLPYSFSSVYGCVAAVLFAYFAIRGVNSTNAWCMFAAGTAAAAAFLCKLEFGAACYVALCLIILARALRRRSWAFAGKDIAAIAPGIMGCAAVLWWMISIAGLAFITEENLASTVPWSFFMKTYGKVWLAKSGLDISGPTLWSAAGRGVFFFGVVVVVYQLWTRRRWCRHSLVFNAALLLALAAYFVFVLKLQAASLFGAIFFPQDMVLYVAVAGVLLAWYCVCMPGGESGLPLAVLFLFAALVGLRILLRMTPGGYPVYYNGLAILAFFIWLRPLIPRGPDDRRSGFRGEALVCAACLAVVALYSVQYTAYPEALVPLVTPRGSIQVFPQVAENYEAAIRFLQQKAALGESVLSVPEDTSVYFLSGTQCPTRLFFFTPGILAPGKMTEEVIRDLERKPVRYLLWSNRTFPDYGAPVFGTDFDRVLGQYLTSHYRLVGPLVPHSDLSWHVSFTVWERR